MRSQEQVQSDLLKLKRTSVSREQWQYLVDIDQVKAAQEADSGFYDVALQDLADTVNTSRDIWSGGARTRSVGVDLPFHLDEYDRARSAVLAREAADRFDVRQFRSAVLGDVLLAWEEVESWVMVQDRRDTAESGSAKRFLRGWPGRMWLEFTVPGDPEAHGDVVHPGRVLDRLRGLARDLSDQFGWPRAEATVFVLTGRRPTVRSVEIEFSPALRPSEPGTPRLRMSIDPALPENRVAAIYGEVRRGVLTRRYRSQTPKHLLLAEIGAMKTQNVTWRELMERWNTQHPGAPFKSHTRFARDCEAARKRLLSPPIFAAPHITYPASARSSRARRPRKQNS